MAYLSSKLTTLTDTASTTVDVDIPSHAIGDLLLVEGVNDVGTSTIVATVGTALTPLTVVNPGAELGVTGWTNETGTLSTGTSNGAVSGASYFDGGTSALVVAYQNLDVSSYAVAIDAGNASFYLSFWVSGFASDADTAGMDISWLNAANVVTATVSGVQTNGATTWAQIETTNAIPVGTRTVRIKMRMIRNDGTNNDGYIDDVSCGITTPTSNTAWTAVNPTGVSDTVRGFIAYKLASTTNETLTLTGANGNWAVNVSAWKDVHQTLPINAVSIIASAVGSTHTTPALTTTAADCTIVHGWHLDSSISSRPRVSESNAVGIARGVNDGTESCGFLTAYRNQPTAGASTPLPATMGLTNGGHVSAIAIRNVSGGTVGQNPVSGMTIYRTFMQGDQGGTSPAPNTVFSATVPFEGIPFSSAALAWSNATLLSDAPQESTGYLLATNNTSGSWTGGVIALTATVNMSSKALSVLYGISSTSRFGSRGFLFSLIDTLGNYAVYRMRLKSGMSAGRLYPFDFIPASHPVVLSSGTPVDLTQINRVAILYHRSGSSATSNGIFIKNFAAIDTLYITGGGTNNPIDLTATPDAAALLRHAYRGSTQGVGQVQLKQPVQIGNGGINYTYFKATATSYELPLPYSESASRYDWNLPSRAGMTIEAGATDVIDFSAAIVRANDPQPFTISSASNASATYSFSGTAIVGWDVTWKSGIPCDSANFSECGVIDVKAATVNNCSITDSRSTTHAMTASNGADITSCRFVKGSETYALNISTDGAIDLTDTTFSGYTNALNVSATSGTVTVSLSLTQAEPTYTTAGAAVVFDRPIVYSNAQVTGFTANSRVIVYNVTTDTEVYNDRPTGTSWSLVYVDGSPFTAGDVVEVYHTYFDTINNATTLRSKTSTSVTSAGWSVLITEENDDVYSAYVNSYSVIAPSIPEFAHDPVNLQIDFTDTDDVWYAHRMYAWQVYTIWLAGERRFFTQMTAVDAANINIGSIVLDNTRANTAYQSDVINVYNSASNLPVLNPTSGGGGITLYSGGKVLLTASAGIAPSEAQIKTWLREELAVEMARIDVATSTRLASADYLAPTLAQIEASTILAKAANVDTLQTSVNAIPVNTLLTTDTRLNNIDVATSTRLAASAYVAPDNTSIAAIKAKTDTLVNTDISTLATAAAVTALGTPLQASDYVVPPTASAIATQVEVAIIADGDGQAVLQAIADKIGNENVSATVIAAQVRTELATELSRIDVATSTRLATADYTAPANADIAAIKAKTDTLENTDISTLATADNLVIVNDGVKLASLLIPHSTDLV
jgi:hypothetical protein